MVEVNFSEQEMEDYLCQPGVLESRFGLRFIARQVNIEGFGRIDILAYHKERKYFVLIELKKGDLDPGAYLQIRRYMAAFAAKYSKVFRGLIIGKKLDPSLSPVVSYYWEDHYNRDVTYRLYDWSFDDGITFNYSSIHQKDTQTNLETLQQNYADIKFEIRRPIRKVYEDEYDEQDEEPRLEIVVDNTKEATA